MKKAVERGLESANIFLVKEVAFLKQINVADVVQEDGGLKNTNTWELIFEIYEFL